MGTRPDGAGNTENVDVVRVRVLGVLTSETGAHSALVPTLLGLTLVTGLIDAVSFLGLGNVFTANMTGNVVFIGFALGGAGGPSVARSLTALAAFAVGSIVGGRFVNTQPDKLPRMLSYAMSIEIACFSVAAFVVAVDARAGIYSAIVLTAIAMGLRNAVVRNLAVPDLTTTVLTLTVTALASESTLAGGTNRRVGRRVLAIVSMLGGALLGAVCLGLFGIAVTLTLAAVIVASLTLYLRLNPT